ncbi:ABC transporter ATP-binding protein [Mobilicoccus massiliensis]|uniref:ABC transporter ATP-binding protein n=1 Tax=Mobilicoccus massiliensis TaxID=1522310 RepID=UPI0009E2896A|nr:ABC transporter ATP-binding protein [Mobilicoccus massiliensis]
MRVGARSLRWSVDGIDIVSGVDLDVEPRTMTAVVGPNGSGKTTLLHLLAGLRRPSDGVVTYDGVDLATLSARERARRCALLEQHPETGLDVSVRHVVELGRIPHAGHWPGRRDRGSDRVDRAMAITEVGSLADRRWPTLSGGERQRTQLARALAQEPRFLLLDEPTNHLDLRHQIALLRTVAGLRLTTVAVLHDLDLAAAFCDRIIVMHDGRVAGQGPTAEVLTPDLVAQVFGVRARVTADDRLRVSWTGLVGGDRDRVPLVTARHADADHVAEPTPRARLHRDPPASP